MSRFVLKTSSGVERTGPFEYRALTEDPYFSFRFWWRRPRYIVVALESLNGSLDPKIYCDRGWDLHEGNAIALQHEGAAIYSIVVAPPRQVKKIRFDPCSVESRFRFWAKCTWSEAGLKQLLVEARRQVGPSAALHDVVLDGTPEKGTRPGLPKRIEDHFASVVKLAEKTAPPIDPNQFREFPFISFVVPVYETPQAYLNDLLQSFRDQPAGSAELILCDDGSTNPKTRSWLRQHDGSPGVRIVRSETNVGIAAATNMGIDIARGAWVGLVDHDDALSPFAVQLLARTAGDNPDCAFIYTDEVVTDARLRPVQYFLKPAYDEVMLSGVNYINHLSCYRRERLLAIGGLRSGYDGSQDYDLLLRYLAGLKPHQIKHLPYPAYRWRRSRQTFSAQFMNGAVENARRALAECYRCGDAVPGVGEAISKTLHRVRFDRMARRWPRVSVVIPNRDSFLLISRVIGDLMLRTDYPDIEVIVADNGTTDARVLALYDRIKRQTPSFKFEIDPGPFNFSRQVNRGIALATGELILLLNNDIEVLEADWLREMVSCFSYRDTGVVGARLLYPTRRLQHVGVIVGLGGLAGHWFIGLREDFPGPMARLHVRQSLTAVTGACMMISRTCIDRVGQFDAEGFAVAYNDIDFCLRAVGEGFRVLWTPFATLIHHESASRGSDETQGNRERFRRDKERLRRLHDTQNFDDRAFSPWYTRDRIEPAVLQLDRLPAAR